LSKNDLRSVFLKAPGVTESIGIEVECAVVDPATGLPTPFQGKDGIRAILERIMSELAGTPLLAGNYLTGFTCESGIQFTLEHGGAIEYGSPPHSDLTSLINEARSVLEHVAEIVRGFGRAFIAGAMFPFTDAETVCWMPKPHTEQMRAFFARLGESGSLGPTVMASTLSTQVTLDYISESDLREKLAMQVAASPVAAAIFANSPLAAGRLTGLLSYRGLCWQMTDASRCGVLQVALEDPGSEAFVDWAMQLPMIYRKRAGHCEAGPDRSFAELLETGFNDGTLPDRDDWLSLLSQIWTDVRLRTTLELRAADGPPYAELAAVPAFWVGLTYHPESRQAASQLLAGTTVADHRRAMEDVAARGLSARLGQRSMLDLARELVALSARGLEARVQAGLERPNVPTYLESIQELVATGKTFAERCIDRWEADLARSPSRYVEAYRVR